MSDYAAALTGAGLWVGLGLLALARWWASAPTEEVEPTGPVASGRHRRTHAADLVAELVPFDELLQYEAEFETPYGAAVVQGWKWCPDCCRQEPSILTRDGWWCGHCTQPIPADHASAGLGDAA